MAIVMKHKLGGFKKKLIILPGWGGTKETWKNFVDLAIDDFDVHVIELPCFGSEPCPTDVWGVEEYADFVKKKILELRTQNPELILLGHSFGGQVATYFVAHNSQLVDKLILSGAPVFRRKKTIKKVFFGVIAKVGKLVFKIPGLNKFDTLAKKILYTSAKSPDYLSTSGIQREIFKKITHQDVSSYLEDIEVPTLVVWGDKDSYVPLKQGREIARRIPSAKLKIIRGGTHGLHLKKTEELFSIIKNFVS
jgi:pimeloyl-ACP methyl ester carboxylesterase